MQDAMANDHLRAHILYGQKIEDVYGPILVTDFEDTVKYIAWLAETTESYDLLYANYRSHLDLPAFVCQKNLEKDLILSEKVNRFKFGLIEEDGTNEKNFVHWDFNGKSLS